MLYNPLWIVLYLCYVNKFYTTWFLWQVDMKLNRNYNGECISKTFISDKSFVIFWSVSCWRLHSTELWKSQKKRSCERHNINVRHLLSKFIFNYFYLKACYFKKVGFVDLSSYGGKIKFEFLVLKIQILFSRHGTQVHKADFLKMITL